jgi:hypothetical protein
MLVFPKNTMPTSSVMPPKIAIFFDGLIFLLGGAGNVDAAVGSDARMLESEFHSLLEHFGQVIRV